jgi:O-antigen/teichoic acid export membrane protein
VLSQIRRLGTDTAIYGISTIVGRFLNFLLVPFYTNVLHPGEYGLVSVVYSIIAFLNIVYVYGLESAYFKYSSTAEVGTPEQNFSTPFVSLLATSSVLSAVILLAARPLEGLLAIPEGMGAVVPCAAGMLFLDTVAVIPFASLRMERKPGLFAALKFLNILVNVGCNLYFLLVLRTGVEGIFYSGVIASGVTALALVPTTLRHFTPRFSRPLYRELLAFGIPYLPAGLATMVIQVIDRPVMRFLTDDATVGVYQANYRLGIFMMLVVSMFDYAWRPFFLSHAKEPGAKPLFARIMTYFVGAGVLICLGVSFFIGDIVRVRILGRAIIHPDYWGGLAIVPVVLLGYLFLGIYNNLVAGVYIEKRTSQLPAITLAGALTNIGANFLLIPVWGMMGGAVATLLAYVVMASVMYVKGRSFYPVPYEWGRLGKIALAGAGAYLLALFSVPESWHLLWQAAALLSFPLLLLLFRFPVPDEIAALRRRLSGASSR